MTAIGAETVVVTGVGGPAGRAVRGYLRERGVRVVGTDMRVLEGDGDVRIIPPVSDAGYWPALSALLDEVRARWLIPTVSEELPLIAERRDAIRKRNCTLLISPTDGVRIANDKWETARILDQRGIAVPRSYAGESKAGLLEVLAAPMLSKPRVGRGGRGVVIHATADDLPDRLPSDRVYQEFLPGDEYDVNLFAEAGGRPVVTIVLRKTALKAGNVGNAAGVERVREGDVARLAEDAVRALSLEGPLDVDVRRGADGRPAILEINARVGANVRSADEVLDAMMAHWEARG